MSNDVLSNEELIEEAREFTSVFGPEGARDYVALLVTLLADRVAALSAGRTRRRSKDIPPELYRICAEIDRLTPIIDDAVRQNDPANYAAVLSVLNANRLAVSKLVDA